MKNLKIIWAACVVVLFMGCRKEPEATFSMSKSKAEVGEEIQFKNQSMNFGSVLWSFGDGSTSTENNPLHSYDKSGVFEVVLSVTGEKKGSDIATKKVEIEIPVNIFPGVGLKKAKIDDTWGTVLSQLGTNYSHDEYIKIVSGNYYSIVHIVVYPEHGIYLFIVSTTASTTLKNSDIVILIDLVSPYIGKTEKNITFGSTKNSVSSAYGSPEYIDTQYNTYEYASLGIHFYFDKTTNVADEIVIVSPSLKSADTVVPQLLNKIKEKHVR